MSLLIKFIVHLSFFNKQKSINNEFHSLRNNLKKTQPKNTTTITIQYSSFITQVFHQNQNHNHHHFRYPIYHCAHLHIHAKY